MKYIGIDIGSTSAKTAVMDDSGIIETFVVPTGWSSFAAADSIEEILNRKSLLGKNVRCVSTGYGRKAVGFADKNITEITCHAKGAAYLFGNGSINIIDIGGQDTKVISCTKGRVEEFAMNDKCSAGTGRFLEIMADKLGLPIDELGESASESSEDLTISAMCTVFAESEVVALVGRGADKCDISKGVLGSVVKKVKQEYSKLSDGDRPIYLTGGLCSNDYLLEMLAASFGKTVHSCADAKYAGAIGAACSAMQEEKKGI